MPYGPITTKHIGKLDSGELFAAAGDWNPDDFTLPFPERLGEFIAEYHDLPANPSQRTSAVLALVKAGAEKQGIKISRSTLNEWLSGGRDPSVSSSDLSTRENIYKLCAALDYDYEQTMDLFEKVFFTRAFNPKNMKELSFHFFAFRDYQTGKEGCSWYQAGENTVASVLGTSAVNTGEKAITDSVYILNETSLMDQKDFLQFLSVHPMTFLRENENAAARKAVISSAMEACKLLPELGRVNTPEEIPYEPLIGSIIAYTQRNTTLASKGISSLKSLPSQLTTNFPTGQILRKICLNRDCSYDQIYKMLSLLLFFCYFSRIKANTASERSFRDFLRFANMSLDRAGCTELYPKQPYGGLLLFCAAQEDPLSALRCFLEEKLEEESEAILQEELKAAFPEARNSTCLTLIRTVDRNPFLVTLLIGSLRHSGCSISPSVIPSDCIDEEDILQSLYECSGFSESEAAVLRYCSLLPPEGICDSLLHLLLDESGCSDAFVLREVNWLSCKNSIWSMDYRIRRTVNQQLDFPNAQNCKSFISRIMSLDPGNLSQKEIAQLSKIRKRVRSL